MKTKYGRETLIACGACGCHARAGEPECPSCGAPMRLRDGSLPRTATAVLLGLMVAAVVPAAACSDGSSGGGAGGGAGGDDASSMSGSDNSVASTYGTGPTTGGFTSTGGGFGGAGGVGGVGGVGGSGGAGGAEAVGGGGGGGV